MIAYRLLNDFASPACQQCIRFVSAVNLEALVENGPDGYKPMLKHLSLALAEVEAFVLDNHMSQMLKKLTDRKPNYTAEQCRVFVRRCVRRQVEAAIFLPLRRAVFRIVYSFVAVQAQCMQRAMGLLQQAAPDYFEVDAFILQTNAMPRAIKAFRDVIQAYLPADQGQLLMHAAAAVMQLHSECSQANKGLKKPKGDKSIPAITPQRSRPSASASGNNVVNASILNASSGNGERVSGVDRGSFRLSGVPSTPLQSHKSDFDQATPYPTAPPTDVTTDLHPRRAAAVDNISSLPVIPPSKPSAMSSNHSNPTLHNSTASHSSNSTLFDFSSKETMADPVGTMFYACETTPDPVLLSRKKSVGDSSPINSSGLNAMDRSRRRGSTGSMPTQAVYESGIEPPTPIPGVVIYETSSTFSPSCGAFLPSNDLEGSTSQAAVPPPPPATEPLEPGTPKHVSELIASVLDNTEEMDHTRKVNQLQSQLKEMDLLPQSPMTGSSSTSSGELFHSPGAHSGDVMQSSKQKKFAQSGERIVNEEDEEEEGVQGLNRLVSVPIADLRVKNPIDEPFPVETSNELILTNPHTHSSSSSYAYFTAEEALILEEELGEREHISEDDQGIKSTGSGSGSEKFGSDAKMTATTTKEFYDVRE